MTVIVSKSGKPADAVPSAEQKRKVPKMEFGFAKRGSTSTAACNGCGQNTPGKYNPVGATPPELRNKGGCAGCNHSHVPLGVATSEGHVGVVASPTFQRSPARPQKNSEGAVLQMYERASVQSNREIPSS